MSICTQEQAIDACTTNSSGKLKAGWGRLAKPTQYTKNAERTVRESAGVFDALPSGRIFLITLTIAGSTHDARIATYCYAGYATSRFNRMIRNSIKCKPDQLFYVCVWETQDRGFLHPHLMVYSINKLELEELEESIRQEWRQILLSISEQSGVDVFAREDGGTWRDDISKPRIEVKEADDIAASCYYLAKPRSKTPWMLDDGTQLAPPTWWCISGPLRRQLKENRLDVNFVLPSDTDANIVIEIAMSYFGSGFNWRRYCNPHTKELLGFKGHGKCDLNYVSRALTDLKNGTRNRQKQYSFSPRLIKISLFGNRFCRLTNRKITDREYLLKYGCKGAHHAECLCPEAVSMRHRLAKEVKKVNAFTTSKGDNNMENASTKNQQRSNEKRSSEARHRVIDAYRILAADGSKPSLNKLRKASGSHLNTIKAALHEHGITL